MAGRYELSVNDLINGVIDSASRLKVNMDSIIEKYNKCSPDDDLIDLYSMEIVKSGDNHAGVINNMKRKIFGASKLKSTKLRDTLVKSRMNLQGRDFNPDVSMAIAREYETVLKTRSSLGQEPSDAETLSSHDEEEGEDEDEDEDEEDEDGDEEDEDDEDSPIEISSQQEEEEQDKVSCNGKNLFTLAGERVDSKRDKEVDESDGTCMNMADEKYDADEEDDRSDACQGKANVTFLKLSSMNLSQSFALEPPKDAAVNYKKDASFNIRESGGAKRTILNCETRDENEEASLDDSFVSISSSRRNESLLNSSSRSSSIKEKHTANETVTTLKDSKFNSQCYRNANSTFSLEKSVSNFTEDTMSSFPKVDGQQRKAKLLPSNLIKRFKKSDRTSQVKEDSIFGIDISYSSLYSNNNRRNSNQCTLFGKSAIEGESHNRQFQSVHRERVESGLDSTFVTQESHVQSYCPSSTDFDGVFKSPAGVTVKRTSDGLVKRRKVITSPKMLSTPKVPFSSDFPGVSQTLSSIDGDISEALCLQDTSEHLKSCSVETISNAVIKKDCSPKLSQVTSSDEGINIRCRSNDCNETSPQFSSKINDNSVTKGETIQKSSSSNSDVSQSGMFDINTASTNKSVRLERNDDLPNMRSELKDGSPKEHSTLVSKDIISPSNVCAHDDVNSRTLHGPRKPLNEKLPMANKRYKPPHCIQPWSVSQHKELSQPDKQFDNTELDPSNQISYNKIIRRADERVCEWVNNLAESQSCGSPSCPPRIPSSFLACLSPQLARKQVGVDHPMSELPTDLKQDSTVKTSPHVSAVDGSVQYPQLRNSRSDSVQALPKPQISTICKPTQMSTPETNTLFFKPMSISESIQSCKTRKIFPRSEKGVRQPEIKRRNCQCTESPRSSNSPSRVHGQGLVQSDVSYSISQFNNDDEAIDNRQKQNICKERRSECDKLVPSVVCRHKICHSSNMCNFCDCLYQYHNCPTQNQSRQYDEHWQSKSDSNCHGHEHSIRCTQASTDVSHCVIRERGTGHHCCKSPQTKVRKTNCFCKDTENHSHCLTESTLERRCRCLICDSHAKIQSSSPRGHFSLYNYNSANYRSEVPSINFDEELQTLAKTEIDSSRTIDNRTVGKMATEDKEPREYYKCNQKHSCSPVISHSPSCNSENFNFSSMNDEEFAQRVSSQILKNIKKYLGTGSCTEAVERNTPDKCNMSTGVSSSGRRAKCTANQAISTERQQNDQCMFPEEFIHKFSPSNPHRIDSYETSQREQQISPPDFKQCLKSFRPRRHQTKRHSPRLPLDCQSSNKNEYWSPVHEEPVKRGDLHPPSGSVTKKAAVPSSDSFHFKIPLTSFVSKRHQDTSSPPKNPSKLPSQSKVHHIEDDPDSDFKHLNQPLPFRASTPKPSWTVPRGVCPDSTISTILSPSVYGGVGNTDNCNIISNETFDVDDDQDISLV